MNKYIEGSVLQSNRQEIKALWSQVFVIYSSYPTESGYSLSVVRGEEGLASATFLALPVSMKSARRSIPEPESNRVSGQSDERKETKIKENLLHNHVCV